MTAEFTVTGEFLKQEHFTVEANTPDEAIRLIEQREGGTFTEVYDVDCTWYCPKCGNGCDYGSCGCDEVTQ